MPYVECPDGAHIYYEVQGRGFPLLLFAPGGINSQVSFWKGVSAINPFDYADEFMVIGMNQRHAEDSPAPLAAPTWETHAADQRAVLDAVGVERALLWGGCIGVAYCLRFIKEAPERAAGAVCQDPVGLVEGTNSRDTFFAMFRPTVELARAQGMQAVVNAALENPLFVRNNQAGPFAARIAADSTFRAEVLALSPDRYEQIIREWDANLWGRTAPSSASKKVSCAPAPARYSSCPATTHSTRLRRPIASAARPRAPPAWTWTRAPRRRSARRSNASASSCVNTERDA